MHFLIEPHRYSLNGKNSIDRKMFEKDSISGYILVDTLSPLHQDKAEGGSKHRHIITLANSYDPRSKEPGRF